MINNNNKSPKINIIMNCHNGEKYLKEAIDSIYAQTYKKWEIIFWDNNSSDNSAKIATKYDERLKYFRGKELVPLYTARNYALNQCTGDAIAFLDCDDIWVPNKLELQVNLLNEEYPIIYGSYEIINFEGKTTGIIENRHFSGKITNSLLKKNSISIGCVLVDSKIFKEFKFDPFYELLGDYDLWIRLSLNYKFLALDDVLEFCRHHDKNVSASKSKLWLKERRYFYKKFLSKSFVLKYYYLLRYILKTEIKGFLEIFKT